MFDSTKVETPFALVNRDKVERNARKVANYCSENGISWRPHVKTHKSRAVADIQMKSGAIGLTVATPREAEVMATVCDDLLLAYPVSGESKLDRIMHIPDNVNLMMGIDSTTVLKAVSRAAAHAGRQVRMLVEADVGMNRVGLQKVEDIVDLALRIEQCSNVEYKGIMFYPGHIRSSQDYQLDDLKKLRSDLSQIIEGLDATDLSPEIVSGGSTPTIWNSHEISDLTEIRSGTCIFYDLEDLHIGVASSDDLAYCVVATVVSTSVPGQAVIDAGSKALSKESRGSDGTFGILLDHPEVKVKGLTEEHGILDLSDCQWRPEIGEMVRVLPSHVCVSANLHDYLTVQAEGQLSKWAMEARGRSVYSDEKSQ